VGKRGAKGYPNQIRQLAVRRLQEGKDIERLAKELGVSQ
jgi:hypothetical protein